MVNNTKGFYKMKDTDKVTLTVGQIKKLIKESRWMDSKYDSTDKRGYLTNYQSWLDKLLKYSVNYLILKNIIEYAESTELRNTIKDNLENVFNNALNNVSASPGWSADDLDVSDYIEKTKNDKVIDTHLNRLINKLNNDFEIADNYVNGDWSK